MYLFDHGTGMMRLDDQSIHLFVVQKAEMSDIKFGFGYQSNAREDFQLIQLQ